MRNEQEEKKAVPATASAEDNIISVTSDLLMKDSNNPEVTLNNAQIDLIEKEDGIYKKLTILQKVG